MNKLRSDSALAQLNDDQLDQLYDWVCSKGYLETIELAAKPVDQGGFNLKIQRTSLVRFRDKMEEERQARDLAELVATASGEALPDRIEKLLQAAKVKLAQATYELSRSAHEPESYDRLECAVYHMEMAKHRRDQLEFQKLQFTSQHEFQKQQAAQRQEFEKQRSVQELEIRQREVAVKEQHLTLERERMAEQKVQWRFNTARAAVMHLPMLLKIAQDPVTDDEDKVWAAAEVCFGKSQDAPQPVTQSCTLGHTNAPVGRDVPGAPENVRIASDQSATSERTVNVPENGSQPENLPTQDAQSCTLRHTNEPGASIPAPNRGQSVVAEPADAVTQSCTLRHTPTVSPLPSAQIDDSSTPIAA